MTAVLRETPLEELIAAADAACRERLKADFASFADLVPGIPKSARECFDLLAGLPDSELSRDRLHQLVKEARDAGVPGENAVERYLVLQAYLVALSLLHTLNVEEEVCRLFCDTCREVASPSSAQDPRLANDRDEFIELAQIVALKRFQAGQLSFDIEKIASGWVLWWSLVVHPLDLPRFLFELVTKFGMFGEIVEPHLCYWRPRPMYMLRNEQDRSLQLIAHCVRRSPRITGMVAWSWLYSHTVGENFPHLAWVRDDLIARNARGWDLGPARIDSGFLIGSAKRRRLYAEGKFRPRETLMLWRRADMMAWAGEVEHDSDPEHKDEVAAKNMMLCRAEAPANTAVPPRLESGRYTLIDCRQFLYNSATRYATMLVLLPSLVAAGIAASLWSLGAASGVFVGMLVLLWVLQYFFLQ